MLRIPREEYWNPVNEVDKTLHLPAFIDIIGLDAQLSSPQDEESVNSIIMNLVIDGKLSEDCDLLDFGKELKKGKRMKKSHVDKIFAVDIIVVVMSAENLDIPQTLFDEIYKEANIKNKSIVFALYHFVDFILSLTPGGK